jgi:hypothetical protein
MWHAWERREKCTGFWWESPKERDYLEDKGVKGRMWASYLQVVGRLVCPSDAGRAMEARHMEGQRLDKTVPGLPGLWMSGGHSDQL